MESKCDCKFWESCRLCKYPDMSDAEILRSQVLQIAQILHDICGSDANLDYHLSKTRQLVEELNEPPKS